MMRVLVLAAVVACWRGEPRVVYVERIVHEHDHVACLTWRDQVPAEMTTPCDGLSEEECHDVRDSDVGFHRTRLLEWALDVDTRCRGHEE